jgi:hypothetical protein
MVTTVRMGRLPIAWMTLVRAALVVKSVAPKVT